MNSPPLYNRLPHPEKINELLESWTNTPLENKSWEDFFFSMISIYTNIRYTNDLERKLLNITSLKREISSDIKNNDIEELKNTYAMMYNSIYKNDLKNKLKTSKHLVTNSKEKPFEVWNVDTQSVERDRKKKISKKPKRKVTKCRCKK